jgi:hypothetical protein
MGVIGGKDDLAFVSPEVMQSDGKAFFRDQ